MIGAVISVPNVPEFDSVYVPPWKSSGFELAGARALRDLGDRVGELRDAHAVGVLDDGRDEAFGAEIDGDRPS